MFADARRDGREVMAPFPGLDPISVIPFDVPLEAGGGQDFRHPWRCSDEVEDIEVHRV